MTIFSSATSAQAALAIVTRYIDEERLLPKTRLMLEELLPPSSRP